MDLSLDGAQQQILDAIDRILERSGGWTRHKALIDRNAYDHELHDELAQSGFFDLALGEETGPTEAALVVERIAEGAAVLASSATALVFPMVCGEAAPGPIALTTSRGGPFRLGQFAKCVLLLDGDEAKRVDVSEGDIAVVDNDRTGWPLARLLPEAALRARGVGPGSGARLTDWWRLGIALETTGAMRGALRTTVAYVKDRVQFGRPIGSFQAIQHRLSQLTVQVEGAYWLALEAAFREAEPRLAATAATHAVGYAANVLRETQQMHGAMGFTREYPLHLWTMRLPALQRELGGAVAHGRAVAQALGETG